MALTKQQKNTVLDNVAKLLSDAKLTVAASYQGTNVKALQELRNNAKENSTVIKVVKNRLVIRAIKADNKLKDADITALNGQLLYAFNNEDEVAPAQVLNDFSKKHPSLQFVGAFASDGKFLPAEEVKILANLPSKNQLISQIMTTLTSPLSDTTNALSGNIYTLLDGIESKASA